MTEVGLADLRVRMRQFVDDVVMPHEEMYRVARYARSYDGPDEVHDMVVGRALLKAPGRLWSRP